MEITYPFAKVLADPTNRLSVFFWHDAQHSTFQQIGDIGKSIVDFCELDFTPALDIIKALETTTVTSANMDDMKAVCWNAVDTLKGKHSYVHFFLNSELVRNFYASERPLTEQVNYARFVFQYYADQQALYREALELCLSTEVLTECTPPERYVMFAIRHPDFQHHMLRTMYGIAPVSKEGFDASKVIQFDEPDQVDTRQVLRDIHTNSEYAVSMQQYFAIQSLEEMLYLELMEMVRRGIRVKRCGLCDRYFALADKRKRNYCDRVYKNGRTCKQVGPKLNFNKEIGDDPFLQEFQRIYNRMYSRYYREDAWDSNKPTKKLTQAEFKSWIAEASKLRREYKQKEISGAELVQRISENSDETS